MMADWIVDDAVFADGRQFDIELDPFTFAILATRLD